MKKSLGAFLVLALGVVVFSSAFASAGPWSCYLFGIYCPTDLSPSFGTFGGVGGATGNTTGNETCVESWNCGSWSACVGGNQTRTCTDGNSCGTTVGMPAQSRGCPPSSGNQSSGGNQTNVTYSLTVIKIGNGAGYVSDAGAVGINCGSDCQENYSDGIRVTLTEQTFSGSLFDGWSGDCVGTTSVCSFDMDGNRNVFASFLINSTGNQTSGNETCIESWGCDSWSACVGGNQTRTCTDGNSCGTTVGMPVQSQSCTSGNETDVNGTLDIVSTPSGAFIFDNGESQGLTPKVYLTIPGTHVIVLSKSGFENNTTTVQVNTGQTTFVNVTLIAVGNETSGNETCVESWNCGSWSACVGGNQTRTCTDGNSCGTTVGMPAQSQSCTSGNETHTACSPLGECIVVDGPGENGCSTDDDCPFSIQQASILSRIGDFIRRIFGL